MNLYLDIFSFIVDIRRDYEYRSHERNNFLVIIIIIITIIIIVIIIIIIIIVY